VKLHSIAGSVSPPDRGVAAPPAAAKSVTTSGTKRRLKQKRGWWAGLRSVQLSINSSHYCSPLYTIISRCPGLRAVRPVCRFEDVA